LLFEQLRPRDTLALKQHHGNAFGGRDVLQGIAVKQQECGVMACSDGPNAAFGVQRAGRQAGGGPERGLRGYAGLHPQLQLTVQGGTVEEEHVSRVGAGD